MYNFSSFLVPPMELSLSVTAPDPLYEMSQVSFTCTIELVDNIDTDKTVTGSWTGPVGNLLTDNSQFSTSPALSTGENVFTTILVLISATASDSGNYTCSMSLSFADQSVTAATSTKSAAISIIGTEK